MVISCVTSLCYHVHRTRSLVRYRHGFLFSVSFLYGLVSAIGSYACVRDESGRVSSRPVAYCYYTANKKENSSTKISNGEHETSKKFKNVFKTVLWDARVSQLGRRNSRTFFFSASQPSLAVDNVCTHPPRSVSLVQSLLECS